MASQDKANTSPAALSTKSSPSNVSSLALKKQFNSLQVILSSKLANDSKLISNKHKHLKNNLCFYYRVGDNKLDFCSKKQTIVTPKGYSVSAATDLPIAIPEKSLERYRAILKTSYRLKATLNFSV